MRWPWATPQDDSWYAYSAPNSAEVPINDPIYNLLENATIRASNNHVCYTRESSLSLDNVKFCATSVLTREANFSVDLNSLVRSVTIPDNGKRPTRC